MTIADEIFNHVNAIISLSYSLGKEGGHLERALQNLIDDLGCSDNYLVSTPEDDLPRIIPA